MTFPAPAEAAFPMPDHRTMEQVMADEAEGCRCELPDAFEHQDGCAILASFELASFEVASFEVAS